MTDLTNLQRAKIVLDTHLARLDRVRAYEYGRSDIATFVTRAMKGERDPKEVGLIGDPAGRFRDVGAE